jgi:hypothetical protein
VSDVITDISGSSLSLDGGRVHWGMMQVRGVAGLWLGAVHIRTATCSAGTATKLGRQSRATCKGSWKLCGKHTSTALCVNSTQYPTIRHWCGAGVAGGLGLLERQRGYQYNVVGRHSSAADRARRLGIDIGVCLIPPPDCTAQIRL